MTTASYQHSETFSRLKGITEAIEGNLTSSDYLKTYDALLYRSLRAVLEASSFVDAMLLKVLAWQAHSPRRKTCAVGKADLPSYVALFLAHDNPKAKLRVFKSIGFDRGVTCEIIRRYLKLLGPYVELLNEAAPSLQDLDHARVILAQAHAHEDSYPAARYNEAQFWFDKAHVFKGYILEKYTRLCLNTAQQDYVLLEHKVALSDLIQLYLATASKAIDKCNSDKGVLTTHIQNWLLSARNTATKHYIDNNVSSDSELAPTANDEFSASFIENVTAESDSEYGLSAETEVERNQTLERIRRIAAHFDPQGYARLVLGVQEVA